MQTDFSSGAFPVGLQTPPVPIGFSNGGADFQRHWLGQFLTGTDMADYQDFQRSEMSANNQYLRDRDLQERANLFAASESQKQRDFQERLSNTAYQRAVADMKIAGINPALVLSSQGGASTPVGSAASSSAVSSRGSTYSHKTVDSSAAIVSGVLKIVGGLLGAVGGSVGSLGKIGF